jgi:hypothetical protein
MPGQRLPMRKIRDVLRLRAGFREYHMAGIPSFATLRHPDIPPDRTRLIALKRTLHARLRATPVGFMPYEPLLAMCLWCSSISGPGPDT